MGIRPTKGIPTRITSLLRYLNTRWWFQIAFIFTPTLGRWSNVTHIFQTGWNYQLEYHLTWLEVVLSENFWDGKNDSKRFHPEKTVGKWWSALGFCLFKGDFFTDFVDQWDSSPWKNPPFWDDLCIFPEHLKQIQVNIARAWKAKCPIFRAIVAGFRGKVA